MKSLIFIVGMSMASVAVAQQACHDVFLSVTSNIAVSTKAMEPIKDPFIKKAEDITISQTSQGYLSEIPSSDGTKAYFRLSDGTEPANKAVLILDPATFKVRQIPARASDYSKKMITKDKYAAILEPDYGDTSVPTTTLQIFSIKDNSLLLSTPVKRDADFGRKSPVLFWKSKDQKSIEYVDVSTATRSTIKVGSYIQQIHVEGNTIAVRTGEGIVDFYNAKTGQKESTLQLDATEYISAIVGPGKVTTVVYNKIVNSLTYPHHHPRNHPHHPDNKQQAHNYRDNHHNDPVHPHHSNYGNYERIIEARIRLGDNVRKHTGDIYESVVSENGKFLYVVVAEVKSGTEVVTLKAIDLATGKTQYERPVTDQFTQKNVMTFRDPKLTTMHIIDLNTSQTREIGLSVPEGSSIIGLAPGGKAAMFLSSESRGDDTAGTNNQMNQKYYYVNLETGKSTLVGSIVAGWEHPQTLFDGKSLIIGNNKTLTRYEVKDIQQSPEAQSLLKLIADGQLKDPKTFNSLLSLFESAPYLAVNIVNRAGDKVTEAEVKLPKGAEDQVAKVVAALKESKSLDRSGLMSFVKLIKTAKSSLREQGKTITQDLANLLSEAAKIDPMIAAFEVPQYNLFKLIKEGLRRDMGMPYVQLKDIYVHRDKINEKANVIAVGTEGINGAPLNIYGFSVGKIAEPTTAQDGVHTVTWTAGKEKATAKLKITKLDIKDLAPDRNPAPNYQEMLADKNLGGAVIVAKNLTEGDFGKELALEYVDYYKQAKFKFAEPVLMEAKEYKESILGQIAQGKIDYLVREGHSEFSNELAVTLSEQVQVYRGNKKNKDGTTETVEVVAALEPKKEGLAEAPISYAELGDRLRSRAQPELDLMLLQTSCWGHCATQQHITDVGTKALIPIASTQMVETFTNEKTSQIYQIVDGIRHMKTYEDIRTALKPTEDPEAFRFPDQDNYLADQQGTPDTVSIRIEIKRNFTVEKKIK